MNIEEEKHKKNIKCLQGSFAVEGIAISKQTRTNLDRLAKGQTSYKELVNEISNKYKRKGV